MKHDLTFLLVCEALLFALPATTANALPTGETVVSGAASFSRTGSQMNIKVSDRAVVEYRSFDIARNESVNFRQPTQNSWVLNRIKDPNPTQISGRINANGNVMLVNPAGIMFNRGSVINVGALVAAAGNISDSDFNSGRHRFTEVNGRIANSGRLSSQADIQLIGQSVENSGRLESTEGEVSLLVGNQIYTGYKQQNIFVSSQGSSNGYGQTHPYVITNEGSIKARQVTLRAGDGYASLIKQAGEIHASVVQVAGGNRGSVEISGLVDATSKDPRAKGGRVEVTGRSVSLKRAKINASGPIGGGDILIGGAYQGAPSLSPSEATFVDSQSTIAANATHAGDGGNVVIWSNGSTRFDGSIQALGLGANARGGSVETSGKLKLAIGSSGRVDTRTPDGRTGTWLLDPVNLTIQSGGNGTINGTGEQIVDSSAINGSAATITLSATQDITINQPISLTTTGAGISFSAGRNLLVNAAVATKNGAISLTADSDKNGTGWLKLSTAASLKTAGNTVSLLVDHLANASSDGIEILGNIDTRISTTQFNRNVSSIQLLGANTTGVIAVGAVSIELGQDRVTTGGLGTVSITADEINLTGGINSLKGSGALNFVQANSATGMKLLSADDSTSGRLDFTAQDLQAISSDFIALYMGRIDSTALFQIGDPSANQSLSMDRGSGVGTFLRLRSGALGFANHASVQLLNTSYLELYGGNIDLKQTIAVPSGSVAALGIGHISMEITSAAPASGIYRISPLAVKSLADNSLGLAIGNEGTTTSTSITVKEAVTLNSAAGGKGGTLTLRCGGQLVFEAPIDTGFKGLSLASNGLQFSPGVLAQIKGSGNISIGPAYGPSGGNAVRDMEVYSGTSAPAGDFLKLHIDELSSFATNFPGTLTLGRAGAMIGGNIRINAPVNLTDKRVNGLSLTASDTLIINSPIQTGLSSSGVLQGITLQGREIDIAPSSASVSSLGTLVIQPVNNGNQSINPVARGMIIGETSNNPSALTITAGEYRALGGTFNRILLGRSDMTGDLTFSGTPIALKATTELQSYSTVRINASLGGSLASDGLNKTLWIRALEVDIRQPMRDLAALQINVIPNGQGGGRKIIVNGATEDTTRPTTDLSMDLTRSDLSFLDGKTIGSLVIGFDGQSYARGTGATSNVPIEVEAGWQLTASTELRSSNQIFTVSAPTPAPKPVYSSITVKGAIDGGGYNLSLICDSNLSLNGGPGSISNVNVLTIQPFALSVSTRIADPAPNAEALVVGPASFSTIGNTVQKLVIGRADSTAHVMIAGPIQLPTDTTLVTNANVIVQAKVDGQSLLTISAGGITQISASLGSETPLKGVTVNYSAKTGEKTVIEDLNGAAVQIRTIQDQIFSEDVELLQATMFEAGGKLTLARSLKAGANPLLLYADELFVSATKNSITGTGALTLGQGNAMTPVAINSAASTDTPGQLDLTQSKLSAFSISGFRSLTLGRPTGAGAVSVKEDMNLLVPTSLVSGIGPIQVEKQINGTQDLTLQTSSGDIFFAGAIGAGLKVKNISISSQGTVTFQNSLAAESLYTDAGGKTRLLHGSVQTTGPQTYGDALEIAAPTTLYSTGGGDIRLAAGATGEFGLNLKTSGATLIAGNVSTNRLETDFGGTTVLSANIRTTGAQTFNDAIALAGPATLTGSTIIINSDITGNDQSLRINGESTLQGSATGLKSLWVEGPLIFKGGLIATSGYQNYTGTLHLQNETSLISGPAGDISLGSGAEGPFEMVVSSGGRAAILGNYSIASLKVLAEGETWIGGSIVTTGVQTYASGIWLKSDSVLRSSSGSSINLTSGVQGSFNLETSTAGITTLSGPFALKTLATGAEGTTRISGDVSTTGGQLYRNSVEILGAVRLESSAAGDLVFKGTLDGPGSLTLLTRGAARLDGQVGSARPILSLETDLGGALLLSTNVTTSGAQTFHNNLSLEGSVTLSGAGVNVQGAVLGNEQALRITGDTTLQGALTGLQSIQIEGPLNFKGGIVATSGDQTYSGVVHLQSATTLSAGPSGNIALKGGADGAFNLSVSTGGKAALLGDYDIASLSVRAKDGIWLGGSIVTGGDQTFSGGIVLKQDTLLRSSSGGAIELSNGAEGSFRLETSTAGITTLSGPFALTSLATGAEGTTRISGDVSTTEGQLYRNSVEVLAAVRLGSSGNGSIVFKKSLDGSGALTLFTSGQVTLEGQTGSVRRLKDLTASAGRIQIQNTSVANALSLDATEEILVKATLLEAIKRIQLNTLGSQAPQGQSTIIKDNGNLTIRAEQVSMGVEHKLVVDQGALLIAAKNLVLGDVAAFQSITLNLENLTLLARAPQPAAGKAQHDIGLGLVAPTIEINGRLTVQPSSSGISHVYLNTIDGLIKGDTNHSSLEGVVLAAAPEMRSQFGLRNSSGFKLQPLAILPPAPAPAPAPDDLADQVQAARQRYSKFITQNRLQQPTDIPFEANLPRVVREHALKHGIWVHHSLEINGRWPLAPSSIPDLGFTQTTLRAP